MSVLRHAAYGFPFPIPVAIGSTKSTKIVVRMQHTFRTFIEKARTPKKAADA
jgi:hypothetical protein